MVRHFEIYNVIVVKSTDEGIEKEVFDTVSGHQVEHCKERARRHFSNLVDVKAESRY